VRSVGTPTSPGAGIRDRAGVRFCVGCDRRVTDNRQIDAVFIAPAAPARRSILDERWREDGQTRTTLEPRVRRPASGHDAARAARGARPRRDSTARRAREKLHLRDPVPRCRVYERWVGSTDADRGVAFSDPTSRLERPWRSIRELHPHHAGVALGGDHRPDIRSKYNFGARSVRIGQRGPDTRCGRPRPRGCWRRRES